VIDILAAMATIDKKTVFLEALRDKYTVRHAAALARVGRRTVYDWREQDAEFAAAWDEAREDAIEALESTMYDKALAGETLPGFFMLKGMRPDVYRDNVSIKHSGAVLTARMDLDQLDPREKAELFQLVYRRMKSLQSPDTESNVATGVSCDAASGG
jgi:hypothetical protein